MAVTQGDQEQAGSAFIPFGEVLASRPMSDTALRRRMSPKSFSKDAANSRVSGGLYSVFPQRINKLC